jgi:hypothetical protein
MSIEATNNKFYLYKGGGDSYNVVSELNAI